MQRKLRTVSLFGAATACGLVLASAASAATLSGTVVHKNAHAKSFVVAGRGGSLTAVHARRSPAVGRKVAVTARRLRNGTWLAQRIRIGRTTMGVRFRGTITYANARRGTFVVSVRGASLLVHRHGAKRHSARAASASSPGVGDVVTVTGTLAGDTVDATEVHHDGENINGVNLEGVVRAIDATTRTLNVSADDSEQSGAALAVQVPASFDLTLFHQGQSVELIVSPNADGTYTLEQSSNDSGSHHADNPGEQQGDGHGDQKRSAEQACAALRSDPTFASSHNGLSFAQFYETDLSKPEDALKRCVDALANGHSSTASPEQQCHLEASDPNFAASHTGLTFAQFYDPKAADLKDAYKNCIDAKSPQHGGHGTGDGGSGESGSGGSGSGGSGGPGDHAKASA
jgi:uncharacterized membrane protein YgcG